MKPCPPTCRGCRSSTVSADAGLLKSIPYWYCPKCRIEVSEYGFEVKGTTSTNTEGLGELEDYLSGEIGRFDNFTHEFKGTWVDESKDEYEVMYDPFLKRTRKVRKGQRVPPPPVLAAEEEVEDDEQAGWLGSWIC